MFVGSVVIYTSLDHTEQAPLDFILPRPELGKRPGAYNEGLNKVICGALSIVRIVSSERS